MNRRFLHLFLVFLAPCWALAQGYPMPDPLMDVLHYRFAIELTDENDSISGQASLLVQWKKGPGNRITIDLIGPREDYPGYGMTVASVRLGQSTVPFSQNGLELLVDLPTVVPGDTASLHITYAGKPADGLIISANTFGDRTFFGDNWPTRARYWLPVIDHPAEKATCEWLVVAPAHYQVIANGKRLEMSDLDAGRRLHHYHCAVPLAPKVMVIGAAAFAVKELGSLRDIPVSAWVYPKSREGGFYDYELSLPILAYYDSLFGLFPYEKLANVQSTTRFGGMENASNIFYDERSVTGQRTSEGLIAHELVHQWFGNSASEADWPHIWLSEGFATYFANVWLGHAHGEERFRQEMETDRRTIFRAAPNTALVPKVVKDPMELLNANSYEKGGWVLHMLRHEVGSEHFFQGVRNYYHRYQGNNATTAEFQAVMEAQCGRELDAFFEQWVYASGYPEISISWKYEEGQLQLKSRQLQPAGQKWDIPVELGVKIPGQEEMQYLLIRSDRRTVEQSFPMESPPSELVWDPRKKLLAEGTVRPE